MRIILDTNIYFSGFIFDRDILKLIDYSYDNFTVFCSNEAFKEINEILFGTKAQKLLTNFSNHKTQNFLDKISLESEFVEPKSKVNICRDPKDNIFLELAKESKAEYLVTGDSDLLVIREFESCKILKPSDFVSLLKLEI
jgi:uncharacterized protein